MLINIFDAFYVPDIKSLDDGFNNALYRYRIRHQTGLAIK
jgi:hypothetical protein